ncbi:MAG: GIY-YIG nuclease family protein [Candidatus Thorarchaeota archaeon]|jgi:Uri superfamily endonuclease
MEILSMKGAYILIIEIEQPVRVEIRSLGEVIFESGTWIYVGSAMGTGSTNLENRLKRHFRSEKTIHWHIDHLLNKEVELRKAYWTESFTHAECIIAQHLESEELFTVGPNRFGSSDCKSGCQAHIFKYNSNTGIDGVIEAVFMDRGFTPSSTSDGFL